jgi:hypothetical protein
VIAAAPSGVAQLPAPIHGVGAMRELERSERRARGSGRFKRSRWPGAFARPCLRPFSTRSDAFRQPLPAERQPAQTRPPRTIHVSIVMVWRKSTTQGSLVTVEGAGVTADPTTCADRPDAVSAHCRPA